ncbi:protein bric-a-brac 2 isoform X2 [Drosophila grimshawi]|uniref:protein bric-a-brac 2 isoform X2 n=1 Tax=Drosophila grimshawi TaxID=7222 RepID=UPI000C86F174|nr:protein bric-a-brac 2 isoform X2 [Drosophila grimshawi]
MDMTKDIMDFERKLDHEQYEPNDYTMVNVEPTDTQTDLAYEPAKTERVEQMEENPKEPEQELEPEQEPDQERQREESFLKEENTEKPNVRRLVLNEEPLTPPPRPLTSSEVVGHTEPDEPELRVQLSAKKSRSLPVSPQPLVAHNLTAIGLFEFGQSSKPNNNHTEHKPRLAQKGLGLGLGLGPSAPTSTAGHRKPQSSGGAGAGDNQQFCLRWNNYQSNLTNVFDELLQSESFVDVTLACEGHSIKAHKMVLSACSPYFQALFYDNPCQHPIIIMRDVNFCDLKALVEFMYKGEINVCQDQINPLLKVAETLKIRGLAEVSAGSTAGTGIGGASLLSEQRMTVYDEDEDEELAILRDADDEELKPKRARLLAKLQQAESALDLNQRQRKRSRDGSYATPSPSLPLALPMPLPHPLRGESPQRGHVPTPSSSASSAGQPLAMTTSTIVRNPFASPNPQTLQSSGSSSSSSTVGNTSCSSANASSSAAAAAYRSNARSCSPPPPPSAPPSSSQLSSPKSSDRGSGQSQLPPHMAAAVAAAAHHASASVSGSGSAVAPPPPPPPSQSAASLHHHAAAAAAQQLAAQHQLAHSHAAMASALGASLAAAAAGGASAPGNGGAGGGGGVGNSVASSLGAHHDDMEIKPEIAEMIREEERAKMIETSGHGWMGAPATGASVADSYQYQLQSMWQKCWNTNQQNLVQQLRFRERGPLKSWRPEAMAEAIFSVLKEGLSLSQAARKYDIPYPTFVLYANRVHNMLGPSLDGGTDPRPKARGRPQRILLGMWPEELIRSVIKAVVFRDYREIKEDINAHQYANGQAHGAHFGSGNSSAAANGYHSAAVKMAAQNAALAPPDGSNALSSMTETLRRQILSQQQQQQHQQQSPHVHSMNMYKSPAYLQRSEIEDQVSAAAAAAAKHQHSERRGSENLPDLSALGLMGLPGLNVMPSQQAPHQRGGGGGGGGAGNGGSAGAAMHPSAASYARELSREREREREMSRDRELKEAMHARQYGNQSRGSNSSGGSKSAAGSSSRPGAASPYSTLYAKHAKEHPSYAYNKRFLESLPAGIDFEAIANGLLHKSVNKSPRFEDFFPGQDMSELFASATDAVVGAGAGSASAAAAAAAAAAAYAPAALRESPLMKIKLEQQQQATELPHED